MQEVQELKRVVVFFDDKGKIERRYAEEQTGVRRENGDWVGQPEVKTRDIDADEAITLLDLPFKSSENAERSARLSAESSLRSAQERITSLEQSLDKGDDLLEQADKENAKLRARVEELEAREAAVKAAIG